MDIKSVKSEIDETEPCFIVEKNTNKIYIPKLMPMLNNGSSRIVKESISLKLDNDSSCKPSFSKKVSVQAFITAKRFGNITYPNIIEKGTRMLCKLINKDPSRIYLDNKTL